METSPTENQINPPMPTKRWYRKWWGRIFLLILFLFIALVVFTVYRISYYVSAIQRGDFSAFKGQIVDVRQLGTPSQVNRFELETSDDPRFGPEDAKVTIVEFSEFSCPFSQQNYQIVDSIRKKYADQVRFIFRDFPIVDIHPYALMGAEAASCANEQGKFWEYHDYLFSHQGTYTTKDELVAFAGQIGLDEQRFKMCMVAGSYHDEALMDLQDGIRFEVKGTPTFFFNGNRAAGVISEETFTQIIDGLLAKAR
ncbi:MAG: DsbA family protein [Janthinobacterium sp.]|jgi:protein-disulfide isomerase